MLTWRFSPDTITMSMYLGRGVVSRGRMGLTPALTSRVMTLPYLRGDEGDREAIVKALDNIRNSLQDVEGLNFLSPADNITSDQYVEDVSFFSIPLSLFLTVLPMTRFLRAKTSTSLLTFSPFFLQMPVTVSRRSNHWMGTAKMGTDDGRKEDGTAVVDTNTKVYGIDNLFVVDASIFPGMVTGNPSAMIVIAAERAAEKILALPAGGEEEETPSEEEEDPVEEEESPADEEEPPAEEEGDDECSE